MGFHLSVIETRRPGSANSPPPSWSLYFLFSPRSDLSLGVQNMGFHLSVIEIRRPGSANSPPPSWFLYFLFSPRNTLSFGVQYMGFHLIVIETRSLSKHHWTSLPGSAPSLLVQQDQLHLFYVHPKIHGSLIYLWGRKDSLTWSNSPNLGLTLSICTSSMLSLTLVLCAVTAWSAQ